MVGNLNFYRDEPKRKVNIHFKSGMVSLSVPFWMNGKAILQEAIVNYPFLSGVNFQYIEETDGTVIYGVKPTPTNVPPVPSTIRNLEKALSESRIRELAKVIEGPHNKLPDGDNYSLAELRERRWDMLSRQEQQIRLNQAKAVLKYIELKEW